LTILRCRIAGEIDPLKDIKNVEFDLLVNDLGQIEKRLERLEKDLKKMKTPELEKEFELLKRAKAQVESDKPLREMEMSAEDKKRIKGFMFLSEKPIFYVLNIGESTDLGKELDEAVKKYKIDRNRIAHQRRGHGDLRQSGGRACRDERRGCGGIFIKLRAQPRAVSRA
jgi:ribosome-binding ATPase YchF (GTP1/OBG family)